MTSEGVEILVINRLMYNSFIPEKTYNMHIFNVASQSEKNKRIHNLAINKFPHAHKKLDKLNAISSR